MNCTKLRNFAALCCKQIVDFFSDLTSYYHELQNEIANLVTSSFQVQNASTLSREDRAELFCNNKQIPANSGMLWVTVKWFLTYVTDYIGNAPVRRQRRLSTRLKISTGKHCFSFQQTGLTKWVTAFKSNETVRIDPDLTKKTLNNLSMTDASIIAEVSITINRQAGNPNVGRNKSLIWNSIRFCMCIGIFHSF